MNLPTDPSDQTVTTLPAVTTAAQHLLTLDNVEGLILASKDNLETSHTLAHQRYGELETYTALIPEWERKYNSTSHFGFWKKIYAETKSLAERIRAHEIRGYDTVFEEHQIPKTIETVQHKSWADYSSSSSEEEEDLDYLCRHAHLASAPSGLVIPSDFETVWPKGYDIITKAAKTYGFELIIDPMSMARAGFKGAASLSTNPDVARTEYARLNPEEQKSINVLKSLFIFMRLTPNEALVQDPKFAVTASFVLHFLLLTGDVEHDAKIYASLKHNDGGKKLILARIESLFQTDRAVALTLMTTVEKVFKAIARSEKARVGGISKELKVLIANTCFTSAEGMLDHYYIRERRVVNYLAEEVDRAGKIKKVKKSRLVNGYHVPALQLGDDLLTPEEKGRLRTFEPRFNMSKLAQRTHKRFVASEDEPENLTHFIRDLVKEAYGVSTMISTVLKQRKRMVRAEALSSGAQNNQITPVQWLAASQKVLLSAEPIPESTFEGIERFLRIWEA